ncbi:MAG: flagellar biosynthetic protein FliR [Clostridia bacterium]|jgi:flagellar biosynthetic protein FliR
MEQVLADIYSNFPLFLLVFFRMTGLFILSPIFGRRNVPNHLKIGFSFLMAVIMMGTLSADYSVDFINLYGFIFLAIKELLVGLILGYVTNLFFSAFILAGQIMDVQIGFGMAQVFDPQYNTQLPLMGNLMNLVALLVFFALDGHHSLIRILFETYGLIPPGTVMIQTPVYGRLVEIFITTFSMAVKISIPIMAAALLTEAALGTMVRAVPQMNMFVVGIPLKIVLTLLVLLLFIPVYISFLGGTFDRMFDAIKGVLLRMGTA